MRYLDFLRSYTRFPAKGWDVTRRVEFLKEDLPSAVSTFQTHLGFFPLVTAMSFAERLGRVTRSAHDKVTGEILGTFVAKCEEHAAQGFCSCTVSFTKPSCFDQQLPDLKQRLEDMAFESCHVQQFLKRFEIQAVWKVGPPEPKKRRKDPHGTTGTCPVCLEDQPVVALTPCGHVVCKQCQASHQFQQCPMCRLDITGATQALFL